MHFGCWMIIGLTLQQTTVTSAPKDADTVHPNTGTTKEIDTDSPKLGEMKAENLMLQPENLKILFVSKDMEQLFLQGASERLNQYTKELGTSLKSFQDNVADHLQLSRHIRSITNTTQSLSEEELKLTHAVVKRAVRNYVVRCCRTWSCSYSSRLNERRSGYGYGYGFGNGYGYGLNGYGGYNPWNGYQTDSNVNQGVQGFQSLAVAMVLPHGVSISCPGCAPGWQQNLNFGHGVGWIPITCRACPKNWRQMLNMGPGAAGAADDYEEEETTTTTTTTTSTTTESTTTTEATTSEETTTIEETTAAVEETTTAAAGGGGGGLLGSLGGLFGR